MIIILFCSVPYFFFFPQSTVHVTHEKVFTAHTHANIKRLTLRQPFFKGSIRVCSMQICILFKYIFCYILRPQTCLSPSHVILIISNTKRGKAPQWLGLITKPLLWLLSLFNCHSFITAGCLFLNIFFLFVVVICLH